MLAVVGVTVVVVVVPLTVVTMVTPGPCEAVGAVVVATAVL